MNHVAVVMAGGVGARLWPRSRERQPKQFTHIIGEGTMIQNTISVLKNVFELQHIFIVTSDSMLQLVREQLPEIPVENIITEPFGRNTAPCIALASSHICARYDGETVMAVFPSDHFITSVGEFLQCIRIGCSAAAEIGDIITLGVQPTRPEAAFGYIQVRENEHVCTTDNGFLRPISTFAEKPDIDTAKRFVTSGDFLWNTGIFFWKVSTFRKAFDLYLPDFSPLFRLLDKHIGKESYSEILDTVYRQLRAISLDYAILEKADNILVIEGNFGWSDVGSWDEVYRLSLKDSHNNAIEGDVIAIDTTNCYAKSNGKLIGLVGVEDLIVVDSDVAIVICKRGASQDVKELINFLRRKQINHFL